MNILVVNNHIIQSQSSFWNLLFRYMLNQTHLALYNDILILFKKDQMPLITPTLNTGTSSVSSRK